MRKINKIIVHCSVSHFGNRDLIDEWHKERGFDEVGYHYVICNPYWDMLSFKEHKPNWENDGLLQTGRAVKKIGAHARGHNTGSIGICLIGVDLFTGRQLITLFNHIKFLKEHLCAKDTQVLGHHELDSKKTCPNLNMELLRELISF
jgi:N-acetylmuramoyl-L-alanine amidase